MPAAETDQAKILISPRFRYLGSQPNLESLGDQVPVMITTGLASANHIVVVARDDALGLMAQTVARIAKGDYLEAHDGGSIQVTQNVLVSQDDLSELGQLVTHKVSSQLRALGVDLVIYGKFFERPSNQIRLDVFLMDVDGAAVQRAKALEAQEQHLPEEINQVVDDLALSVRSYLERRKARLRRRRFAVLPFRNLSDNPRADLLRQGLTEELITVLKNARALELIERSVTARFGDAVEPDLPAVGRELGVDVVLSGSFDTFEDENKEPRIVIRARLVATDTGEVLNTFKEEGQYKANYAVQAHLAQNIMRELNVQPVSVHDVEIAPTSNVDALDYVRIGIHHLHSKEFEKAIDAFQAALKRDPEFSEAHFYLGATHKTLKAYGKALDSFKSALGNAYDRAFGKLLWRFDAGWKIIADMVLVADTLLVSAESKLIAVDKDTGAWKWFQSEIGDSIEGACISDGNLFVATERNVYSIGLEQGDIRGQIEIAQQLHGIVGDREMLYLVGAGPEGEHDQGMLQAYGAKSGTEKWQFKDLGRIAYPCVMTDSIAIAGRDELYVLRADNGAVSWKYSLKSRVARTPVHVAQTLFVVDGDTVRAFGAQTGDLLWDLMADADGTCAPIIDGGTLFAGFDKKVYAIDRDSGLLKWIHKADSTVSSLSVADGMVFATSANLAGTLGRHTLLVIDCETGQSYWEHNFSDTIYARPIICGGVLYLGNRNHDVYAFNIQRPRIGLIRSAEIWNQIADVHGLQKDGAAAIHAYKQCIEIDPTFREAYRGLFEIYRKQRRRALATYTQQEYLRRLDESERFDAEQELRAVSGLLWTYDTPAFLSVMLVPLSIDEMGMEDGPHFSPVVPCPQTVDGSLYIGLQDGSFVAIDATTGALEWTHKLGGEHTRICSSAAFWKNLVCFGASDGAIYALERTDGRLSWKYQTGGAVDSTPVIGDGLVYVGSDDGKVYALRAESGELLWSVQTQGRVKSSPELGSGKVYIGSYDGKLYALDGRSGAVAWQFQSKDIINSSPRIYGDTVYLGPDDNRVYALDAESGAVKWQFQTEGDSKSALTHDLVGEGGLSTFGFVPSTPAYDRGMIFVGSNGGSNDCKLYALDEKTGEVKWTFKTENECGSPAVFNGVVFVGAGGVLFHGQTLYGLRVKDGSLVWQFETLGDVLSAPTITDGVLHCWSLGGKLYAFDVRDVAASTPEKDANFYVARAQVQFQNERFEQARATYQQAVTLDSGNIEAQVGLADSYDQLGQQELHVATLLRIQSLNSQATHTYWRLAQYFLGRDDPGRAIEQVNGYLKVLDEPEKPIGHWLLGVAQLKSGNDDRALQEFDSAIQIGARYLDRSGGNTHAIQGYFFASERKAEVLYALGRNLEGQFNETQLERAKGLLESVPSSYHIIRGLTLIQEQDYGTAAAHLEEALLSEPADEIRLTYLATACHKHGEPERALRAFDNAVLTAPENALLLANIGAMCHELLFQFEKAYEYDRRAVAADPSDQDALASLAEAAFTAGQPAESRRLAGELIAASNAKRTLCELIARTYYCMSAIVLGDVAGAREALVEFIESQVTSGAASASWGVAGIIHHLEDSRSHPDAQVRAFLLCLIRFMRKEADLAALEASIPPRFAELRVALAGATRA